MGLKLRQLQQVAKDTITQKKREDQLREEITRVLGPIMRVDGSLSRVAADVNDRLNVLERTGRFDRVAFKPAIMVNFIDHPSNEVRAMHRFINDDDFYVRHEVAKKSSVKLINEMIKRNPCDAELRHIKRQRLMVEDTGIKLGDHENILHLHDEEPLGDLAKSLEVPDLSDQWYQTTALKLVQDYGGNLERQWEEIAVNRFCDSNLYASKFEVDKKKLLKHVLDILEKEDDIALEKLEKTCRFESKNYLREIAERLNNVIFESDGLGDEEVE